MAPVRIISFCEGACFLLFCKALSSDFSCCSFRATMSSRYKAGTGGPSVEPHRCNACRKVFTRLHTVRDHWEKLSAAGDAQHAGSFVNSFATHVGRSQTTLPAALVSSGNDLVTYNTSTSTPPTPTVQSGFLLPALPSHGIIESADLVGSRDNPVRYC